MVIYSLKGLLVIFKLSLCQVIKQPGFKQLKFYRHNKPSLYLALFKRWVSAFKEETLNIAIITNHETEHQNKLFKHKYLEDYRDRTLSEMLDIVTHVYIPKLRRT